MTGVAPVFCTGRGGAPYTTTIPRQCAGRTRLPHSHLGHGRCPPDANGATISIGRAALKPVAKESHERLQRRARLASARIIEEESVDWRRCPFVEHGYESSCLEMRGRISI